MQVGMIRPQHRFRPRRIGDFDWEPPIAYRYVGKASIGPSETAGAVGAYAVVVGTGKPVTES